jgi:tetratricopeptide (TPR) repeat protein
MTFAHRLVLLAGLVTLVTGKLLAQHPGISDQEARNWGLQIENSMMSGDPSALNSFVDFESILKRVQQGSDIAKDPSFVIGARSTWVKVLGHLGDRVLAATQKKGGSFRLLKEYEDQGVKHLLFRANYNPGINYLDFRLMWVGDSIKSDDYLTYNVEDWMSSTMAALANTLAASDQIGKDSKDIRNLKLLYEKKDFVGFNSAYKLMDSSIRNTKLLSLMYVHACRALGDSLYLPALNQYVERFPDAPSGCLMQIDLAYLKKDYALGLWAINRLDSLVGGDPFLNFDRGTFYFLLGKMDESLVCHEKAFQYDPSIKNNSIDLAGAYIRTGQTDKARLYWRHTKRQAHIAKAISLIFITNTQT